MSTLKSGKGHQKRMQLFQLGLRRGFITPQEIESAMPWSETSDAERWLLYYSLQAAQVEIRDQQESSASSSSSNSHRNEESSLETKDG